MQGTVDSSSVDHRLQLIQIGNVFSLIAYCFDNLALWSDQVCHQFNGYKVACECFCILHKSKLWFSIVSAMHLVQSNSTISNWSMSSIASQNETVVFHCTGNAPGANPIPLDLTRAWLVCRFFCYIWSYDYSFGECVIFLLLLKFHILQIDKIHNALLRVVQSFVTTLLFR
jgi:hypothetical protein